MFEWSDLRYFLAVAKTGSTAAAAQDTRVSQTTVARRLSALEDALRLKLIERTQTGSRLTEAGEQIRAAAERVEAEIEAFTGSVETARRRLAGVIRFTMPPEAVEDLMSNPIRLFMAQHPGVKIEVLATHAFLDIAAGDADIALRAGRMPTNPELIVRKAANIEWTWFCSPDYLARLPPQTDLEDISKHPVIGAEGQIAGAAPMRWLADQTSFAYTAASPETMASFARAGLGIVMLPAISLVAKTGLVPFRAPLPDVSDTMWIVTRDDVRRQPAVRAFIDFIVAHLAVLEAERLGQA